MNKNKRKSKLCSQSPSIFDGSISSRRALTQKVIDEMVIVYYIFDGKFFSEFLNVQINV